MFDELVNMNDHSNKKNMTIKLSHLFTLILSLRTNVKIVLKVLFHSIKLLH
jgi:hypothetical protein